MSSPGCPRAYAAGEEREKKYEDDGDAPWPSSEQPRSLVPYCYSIRLDTCQARHLDVE